MGPSENENFSNSGAVFCCASRSQLFIARPSSHCIAFPGRCIDVVVEMWYSCIDVVHKNYSIGPSCFLVAILAILLNIILTINLVIIFAIILAISTSDSASK